MARISTYSVDNTPSLDDKLIGTDVNNSSATKNYLISDILALATHPTPTLSNVLISGNNSGANGIFFDGATKAVFNTDLQIYSDAVIGYILADTLQLETENDISLKSDTQVTFNILNSDKLKITSLGVQSVADLFVNAGLYDGSGLIGTVDQVLTSTATGTLWKTLTSVTGSGTTNYIPKWLNVTSELVDSIISDNGTYVTVEGRISQTTLGESTFFGDRAGENDDLTNRQNTSFGFKALQANILGTSNTAIGYSALLNNTGESNTAIGFASLTTNTLGIYNTGVGIYSLRDNLSGIYNTAFGTRSLISNTSGNYNISVGVDSLGDNTIGDYNISMGRNSGRYITDGVTSNTSSEESIFIGNNTKALADSQTNQIIIGYNTTGNGSNSVVLGNDSILTTKLKGDVSISGALLDSSSSAGTSGQVLSSTVTGTDWIDNEDDTLMSTISVGASRSLLLTDRDNNIENSASVTITIPLNSSVAFPIGSQIYFTKKFVTMDFAVTAGVTLNSVDNLVDMGRVNSGVALLKIATDEWNLVGELV